MGIHNLNVLLKKYNCSQEQPLSDFKGKVFGIDTSIFLHKFLYENDNYLISFIKQIVQLRKHSIIPVYIFDGKPDTAKNDELDLRQKRKEHIADRIQTILTVDNVVDYDSDCSHVTLSEDEEEGGFLRGQIEQKEDIQRLQKQLIYVTSEHYNNLKKMLDLIGIPWFQAEQESDQLLCQLSKDKIIDCVVSEDMDMLPYGSSIFIRSLKTNFQLVNVCYLETVLTNLDVTYDQFVDICILCGCDYTNKIRGIGPINAYLLIKKYKNLSTFLRSINETKYTLPEEYEKKCDCAKSLFSGKVNHSINNISLNDFSGKDLITFLNEKTSMKNHIIASNVITLKKLVSFSK